jgi:NAD(P)-dependent dehydrogenase (short-subunit alcohol dehydrogenase family)
MIFSVESLLRTAVASPGLLCSLAMTIEWQACHHDLTFALFYHLLILFLYSLSSFNILPLCLVIQWILYVLLAQYYGRVDLISFPIRWVSQTTGKQKVALVTGVNFNGIGFEISKSLIKLGYDLVFVDLHPDAQMKRLCEELLKSTDQRAEEGTGTGVGVRVSSITADLTNYQEVAHVVEEFLKRYSHLDVLINNAGGMIEGQTPQGSSKTIALCLHAPIILTREFLPLLSQASTSTSKSRVVNTCSSTSNMLYLLPSFRLSQLEPFSSAAHDPSLMNYARAKFCLKYWVKLLHLKLLSHEIPGVHQPVLVNSFHPGAVGSNIFSPLRRLLGDRLYSLVMAFLKLSLRSPQEGSITGVYLAASSEVRMEDCGSDFYDCQRVTQERFSGVSETEETFLRDLERYAEDVYRDYKQATRPSTRSSVE